MIPARIEVIGPAAFSNEHCDSVIFESGTRLREIDDEAFSHCEQLESFTVPSSVERIGDRCFDDCCNMTMMRFEQVSKLRRVGESAFRNCRLASIRIPASVDEVDGSAFVGCPLLVIEVAAGNRNFRIEGGLLRTTDGTTIVRYFGREREVIVPKTVEIVGKSCFESWNHFERVVFENGSKLRRISPSAFSGCEFLTSISIPASVEMIGDSAFKKCDSLAECLVDENAVLGKIGKEAFADCRSLRSFCFPKTLREVDEDSFVRCDSLQLLIFASG
jgi:hypothetical protein